MGMGNNDNCPSAFVTIAFIVAPYQAGLSSLRSTAAPQRLHSGSTAAPFEDNAEYMRWVSQGDQNVVDFLHCVLGQVQLSAPRHS
jgi:hypothetical protein